MAKKWYLEIQTSVKSELRAQNCPFFFVMTLKCIGLFDKNVVGVWPPYRATPHTF